jgi:methionyl-tRNA formyltransferase
LRVVFAGTPEFALPALKALLTQHHVVGVLTQPDRPRGRGRTVSPSPVKALAQAHHLPIFQPQTLRSEAARAQLAALHPDALIVVAYGLILPPPVLEIARLGCLNIHPSLLPRWRGAAPVQRAILAGDTTTGVCIVRMDQGLDTGPVLLQEEFALGAHVTSGSLHSALASLGAAALIRALAGLEAGTLQPRAQSSEGVTYAPKVEKAEARIDWRRPAADIERQVRAFNPQPIAETRLEGQQLRIYDARALPRGEPDSGDTGTIVAIRDGSLLVRCGIGLLAVSEVQKAGGRVLPVSAFAHNTPLAGQRLG